VLLNMVCLIKSPFLIAGPTWTSFVVTNGNLCGFPLPKIIKSISLISNLLKPLTGINSCLVGVLGNTALPNTGFLPKINVGSWIVNPVTLVIETLGATPFPGDTPLGNEIFATPTRSVPNNIVWPWEVLPILTAEVLNANLAGFIFGVFLALNCLPNAVSISNALSAWPPLPTMILSLADTNLTGVNFLGIIAFAL